ncbi:unnamed protein product [Lactuca saligna]|uniref:DNA-directed RNA polymerase III subunit n=1 Tax=Lactuca saligna TaxID=75948 RepID=A0AA35ZJR8_LACSI|nr:unnamed protein product [Lactuca saligna]
MVWANPTAPSPSPSRLGHLVSEMSWRGRGRGRGGFGGGYVRFAKEEKYEVFPEITDLPDVNLKQKKDDYWTLVSTADNLQKFWNSSPYYLGDLSEGGKKSINSRPPLSDYMMLTTDYVPAELVGKNVRPMKKKKTQWDLQSDLQRLDLFEKLDLRPQNEDEEKKDDEEEDEDIENMEEEEDDSQDDYALGRDYDDDEDDFNMNDDHADDEGCY